MGVRQLCRTATRIPIRPPALTVRTAVSPVLPITIAINLPAAALGHAPTPHSVLGRSSSASCPHISNRSNTPMLSIAAGQPRGGRTESDRPILTADCFRSWSCELIVRTARVVLKPATAKKLPTIKASSERWSSAHNRRPLGDRPLQTKKRAEDAQAEDEHDEPDFGAEHGIDSHDLSHERLALVKLTPE